MTSTERIAFAEGIHLPHDIGSQRVAVCGVSGSGKTYGAGKIVEAAVAHGHQVVILDVVGNWRGLRLAADGVSPGIAMPVLGGPAGDAPLSPRSGEMVARLVATRSTSLIVDLSDFVLEEQAEFVRAFAATLLLLKTRNPGPVMVVWEECHETIPQVSEGKLQARAVGAAVRLIKRGRNYGVGTLLITQRPAAVAKEALSQCDTLVAFALTESNDRAAIKRQATAIRGHDNTPTMADLGRLPELETGTAILWSPRWLRVFREVRVLPKWTFDFSRTPDAIASARGALAPIDLEGLRAALDESGAVVDQDDVEALRTEIERLRAQVAHGGEMGDVAASARAETDRMRDERDAALARARDAERLLVAATTMTDDVREAIDRFTVARLATAAPAMEPEMQRLATALPTTGRASIAVQAREDARRGGKIGAAIVDHRAGVPRHHGDAETITSVEALGKCARAVLAAIATRHPRAVSRRQAATLSGYSHASSNFANALGELRAARFLDGMALAPGRLKEALRHRYQDQPSICDLWYAKLRPREADVLREVVGAGERGLARDELARNVALSAQSSNYANILGTLNGNGLLRKEGGRIKAAEELLEDAQRRAA